MDIFVSLHYEILACLKSSTLFFCHSGSHHFVCCVDISMPENPSSPHGNYNPLGQVRIPRIRTFCQGLFFARLSHGMALLLQVIKAASNSSSYSWCTCSEEICEEQLGGRVAWNQHGVGWKGFAPAYDRPVLNSASGLPSSEL